MFSLPGKKVKNDIIVEHLKRKIKSIVESNYSTIEKSGNFKKSKLNNRVIYRYNTAGNMAESGFINEKDSTIINTRYFYDCNQKMIEVDYYSSNIKLIRKYDEIKNEAEDKEFYSDDNRLKDRYVYKYDERGKLVELQFYFPDDSKGFNDTYKYDDKGNMIASKVYYRDGTSRHLDSFKYDENGNEIEWKNNTLDGCIDIIKYKYLFDKEGNWIQKTILDGNGQTTNIEERIIEYY